MILSTKQHRQFVAALALAVLLMAASLAAAQQQPQSNVPNPAMGFSQNRNEPIHIEALKLEVRDKEKVATFTGNVKVVQGDTTMKCKVLVVYYDSQNSPGTAKAASAGPSNSQQIRKLEAKGDVIVTQKDQVATGENGVFDVRSNTVTLTGNVVVNQGPNVLRGERMVVDLTTGVSRVDAGSGPVQMMLPQRPSKDNTPSSSPKIGPGKLFSN